MGFDQGAANMPTVSRIETDVETIKGIVSRIENTTTRIIGHARSLGYFESPNENKATPTPVVTTLADALQALDHAVNHCSDAINVFD